MCVGIKVVVGVSGKPPSQEQTLIKNLEWVSKKTCGKNHIRYNKKHTTFVQLLLSR
jgi:hypothetical protein